MSTAVWPNNMARSCLSVYVCWPGWHKS